MLYRRQKNTILEGERLSAVNISKSIQGGFQYQRGSRRIYTTQPSIKSEWCQDVIEWAIENDKKEDDSEIELQFQRILIELQKIYGDSFGKLLLRQKEEIVCVNKKKSLLQKYELKVKGRSGNEHFFVCAGGSGKLERILTETNFFADATRRLERIQLPLVKQKLDGKLLILLGNQATGFLCHEAVGHMAESDTLEKGSAFWKKLGKKVFDSRVNVIDSGLTDCGAGNICFPRTLTQ